MAKKVKAKKTTTTTKKKETAKPKAQEKEQPDVTVEAQVAPEPATRVAESESVELKPHEAPILAPSVAVTTRERAPVPASIPDSPPQPSASAEPVPAVEPVTASEPPVMAEPAPVAEMPPTEELLPTETVESSEPVFSEPPPTGVLAILNVAKDDDAAVNEKNLSTYRAYVEGNLELPAAVEGREPFGWERVYAWGLRDRAEYEKRKAFCPSYTDSLEIVGFDEHVDCLDGITARVSRPADGKEFTLPLGALKSTDLASRNAEILDEYAGWLTQYC